jgi:hypothetical protein
MSIRQNLRILNKPISELAMLPQETIMTMAQSGQIPVAFVAPILAEKAEASQRAVEAEAMMAQQQQDQMAVGSGSVIEKIIAQNAANETQANMPMMAPPMPEAQGNMPMMGAQMPEDVGIGALPVPDEMIPGLAGGGIIAFQNRGLVEDEPDPKIYGGTIGANPNKDADAASGLDSLDSPFSGLGKDIAALQAAKEAFVGPNQSVADLIAYNQEAEKRAAERAKSQFNTRLIEAGLLGLSGDSPYFGVNLGKMAPAVRGMSEDTEKQAEAKEARIKSELAAKGIERKEKETTFGQTLADRTAKEKNTPEDIRKAQALQKEARDAGKRVPTFTEAIKSIERTPGTATVQAAILNAQAKRATARNEALSNLRLDSEYNKARKKGDTATVNRLEREAVARVDAQYADFLPPGADTAAPAAPSKSSKPTEAEFLKRARPDNPGVSEKDLKDYYKKTYGG